MLQNTVVTDLKCGSLRPTFDIALSRNSSTVMKIYSNCSCFPEVTTKVVRHTANFY